MSSREQYITWRDIDEGVTLFKICFKHCVFILLPVMIIILLLSVVLLNEQNFYWIIFILWWLKPVYDRISLTVFADYVSKDKANITRLIKNAFNNLMTLSLIKDLTIRRFSLMRSYKLPVYMLENKQGSQAANRFTVLLPGSSSRASSLSFMAMLLEIVVAVTIISLAIYLIPEGLRGGLNSLDELINQHVIIIFFSILYIVTLVITEPLYVASGFNLYMNKRKRLEAWDIELDFKSLANRLHEHQVF